MTALLMPKETLSKKLEQAKQELETSEAQLVNYAKNHGIIENVDGDRSAAGEVLTSLNHALTDAKGSRIAAEETIAVLKTWQVLTVLWKTPQYNV